MSRTFEIKPAVRGNIPLLLSIVGPPGSGKTKSALRLATGMQKVFGGNVHVIDTESGRALHYADQFNFQHIPFSPPYSPNDYLEAIEASLAAKPGVLIIDQFSFEHDGPGGVLEMHEHELDRMAGNDWRKREKCSMAAWIKPKAMRRALINHMVQIGSRAAIIMLFRAKESTKPVKHTDGSTGIEKQGWVPIAGLEYLYEATAGCVLPVGGRGTPIWQTTFDGERVFIKRPDQFMQILKDGGQLDESMGQRMAEWARGGPAAGAGATAGQAVAEPPAALVAEGEKAVAKGLVEFQGWWEGLTATERVQLKSRKDAWKEKASKIPDA
jgi:hypothetical protein